jgi:osmoprotectant transport system permease protein
MTNLVDTFVDRFHEWAVALGQHIQLSLVTLLVAIIISIPAAILLSQHKKGASLMLQVTGILQTIPSLALLGLFIPLMGIGTLPALSALVIYAIFPIFQSTLTGLSGIDPSLIEAGEAFGMTKLERLKKFEIALAMPVIMSGIRTSAVITIGTATLAALIGAGGLGSFILLGIDRNNSSLILIGAISSAILAIFFNLLLKFFEKAKLKTIGISFMLLVIAVVGSFTPAIMTQHTEQKTIVIAGKMGPEPEILINMYKLLIESDSKLTVTVKPNFGKTSFLYDALKSGDIDIYPEFTGTITSSLLKPTLSGLSNDAVQVYQAARDGILKQDKLVLLPPMAYQNTYAVAVPKQLASTYHLTTISDLKQVQDKIKAGFTIEFNDREDGNKGLKSVYGLTLTTATMEPALRYQAIKSGSVQVVDAYATDPEITKYDLVVLKDDKHLFPPYQGAPLMKATLLKKYPEIKQILTQLSGKISEEEMSKMNYEVGIEGKSAASVAKTYLEKHQMIK